MKLLNSLAELNECSAGEQVSFAALLVDIKLMTTSTNKEYVRLYFRDDKAAVSVPLWNDTLESATAVYAVDKIYSVAAVTDTYKDSISIKKIMSAAEITDEKIQKRLRQHMFKQATDENINIILAAVTALKDTEYFPVIKAIYGDGEQEHAVFQRLLGAFASINHHDNYPGGYINHIGGMLHLAANIRMKYLNHRCESKWQVDWQYITAAILLHDIGKLQTYSNITQYTIRFKDGCTLDHNVIGVGMLYEICGALPEDEAMSYETMQNLAYTICYHDNIDKLYTHKRTEDKIISYIDGLDATLAVACALEV